MGKHLHQGKEGGKPDLVVRAGNALLKVLEAYGAPALLHHGAGDGDLDSKELVPFPVLAGAGLEKAGEAGDLGRIGLGKHPCQEDIHSFFASITAEAPTATAIAHTMVSSIAILTESIRSTALASTRK